MKLGIGITVHNRNQTAYDTISKWQSYLQYMPVDSRIVVVDDASTEPLIGSDWRFDHNVGIAVAKNKCLELLQDCDHIFLSDDDCYPKREDWWVPYVESGINHLSFTFDKLKNGKPNGNTLLRQSNGLNEYMNPCGCLLYINKKCLDVVGGFDTGYMKWGYEHVDFSRRVFNAGLTPRPFLDIPNSLDYLVSLDYERAVASSVPFRHTYYEMNKKRYLSRIGSKEFAPYVDQVNTHGGNVVFASYFTYSKDTQRNMVWESDAVKLEPLLKSLKGYNVKIFNDCFEGQSPENVEFIRIEPSNTHSPNVYRWLIYYEYLLNNRFDKVWMVDVTDVECLRDPFGFECGKIYCGNEFGMKVDNIWMRHNQERFVKGLVDYRRVIQLNGRETLLNCGLVGGCYPEVMELLSVWSDVHQKHTAGLLHSTDMAVFNYVIWKYFRNRHVSGEQINTRFKKFEINDVSWWRHK